MPSLGHDGGEGGEAGREGEGGGANHSVMTTMALDRCQARVLAGQRIFVE